MSQEEPPGAVDSLLRAALAKVVAYCSQAEVRRELDDKLLTPLLAHASARFAWAARLFQVVAALVLVQTLLLLWMLVRDARRIGSG